MTRTVPHVPRRAAGWLLMGALAIVGSVSTAHAQGAQAGQQSAPTLEIYGFGQADLIADFKQTNPDWYDVVRPSRLPSFPKQFGEDGRFHMSVRQSRLGARGTLGDVRATFEFDMFGVGEDAGQTTIRLRHAYGQWKQIGAGQTNSQFMDIDVFPNVIDYWGPNGMLFFRNIQLFWEPFNDGTSHARIAIEQPGASGDKGIVADRIELQDVQARFPSPDFTGHYRYGGPWGHLQLGGAVRLLKYDDLNNNDRFDLNGSDWGWGVSVSSNLKATPNDTFRLQFVYGEGIQNYFNDAPVDIAAEIDRGNPRTPVVGKALPILGFVAYLDHNWSSTWSTSGGYSQVDINNTNGQTSDAYHKGHYGSVNLLHTPVPNVMMGGEFQWARRENFGQFQVNDWRAQFSFKYSFSQKIGG